MTMADLFVAGCLSMGFQMCMDTNFLKVMTHVTVWFQKVANLPAFKRAFGDIKMAQKIMKPSCKFATKPKPVKEEKKVAKKEVADDEEDAAPKKKVDPLDALPPTHFNLYDFKTLYVNHPDKKGEAIEELLRQFDNDGWAFWYLQYEKFGSEGEVLFKTINLCNGFLQRFEDFRKNSFAKHAVLGEEPCLEIEGVWLFRGTTIPQAAIDHPQFEYYKQRKLDVSKSADVDLIRNFWGGVNEGQINGMKVQHIAW